MAPKVRSQVVRVPPRTGTTRSSGESREVRALGGPGARPVREPEPR